MTEYLEREVAMTMPVLPKRYRQFQTDNLDDAYEQGWMDALDNLKNSPADVAPVRHGRWEDGDPICPVCGEDKFKDLDADIWSDWKPSFLSQLWCKNERTNIGR